MLFRSSSSDDFDGIIPHYSLSFNPSARLSLSLTVSLSLSLCLTHSPPSSLPQWPYGDICGITPVGKGQGTEFNLTFRKGSGKKSETLKFSTEHRTELLTEALVRGPGWAGARVKGAGA